MRAAILTMAVLTAATVLGCGRSRPAESYKGPVRVRIQNASLGPIAQAMLMPVGTLETQPWVENIAAGGTAEVLVRPDRYDLWFVASLPELSPFVLGGGKLDVPLTGPTTIVVERDGMRPMARSTPDAIVITLKQLSKTGK